MKMVVIHDWSTPPAQHIGVVDHPLWPEALGADRKPRDTPGERYYDAEVPDPDAIQKWGLSCGERSMKPAVWGPLVPG